MSQENISLEIESRQRAPGLTSLHHLMCEGARVYVYIYILSDDRITRETLSNNNPCPSSPSSTILRSAYMALNTLQQDWLL